MSIKNGINKGDMVFISAVDTKDPLYEYSKRPKSKYCNDSEHKLTSLIGMTGELISYRESAECKSGFCKAILRFSLPTDFFENKEDENISWWNRAYRVEKDKKMKPLKEFDILFSKGVKLEGISDMPSSLRYVYLQSDESIVRDFVRPAEDSEQTLLNVLNN